MNATSTCCIAVAVVALVGLAVLAWMQWHYGAETALPRITQELIDERGARPVPTEPNLVGNATIMTRKFDKARFAEFLAWDVARHGGRLESFGPDYRRSVYVAPFWYYEALRSLQSAQQASADRDPSLYARWTERMANLPAKVANDDLTRLHLRFETLPRLAWLAPWGVIAMVALLCVAVCALAVISVEVESSTTAA